MPNKNERRKKRRPEDDVRTEGQPTMNPDPFPSEPITDPSDGAAFIPPVTAVMMDHAAHAAAELADGVAHAATVVEDMVSPSDPVVGEPVADDPVADEAAPDEASLQALPVPVDDVPAEAGASDALARYNAKLVSFTQSNMAATGELFSALMEVKSLPEAMALNADHLRRRMDALTLQGRELAALAQTVALDAFQPFKDAIAQGTRGR